MELYWQLEALQPSTVINLAASAGSRLESFLLDELVVDVQFYPVETYMWLGDDDDTQQVNIAS